MSDDPGDHPKTRMVNLVAGWTILVYVVAEAGYLFFTRGLDAFTVG